jgi:hypothetical protein
MPLTRTRRRILIATLVVVGILFAWWATQVDRRFVGEWPMGSGNAWRFFDNGSGEWLYGGLKKKARIEWTVHRNRLIVSLPETTRWNEFRRRIWLTYASATGAQLPDSSRSFAIIDVQADRLTLQERSDSEPFTLTRTAESPTQN